MPLPTAPDWLTLRDGSLKSGVAADTMFVMLSGHPQYKLEIRPATGTFTCAVAQTVNGRRLDDGTAYPTPDAAMAGGLEQLRTKLGW